MKSVILLSLMLALSVSCSTLDQSFKLGATTGALTGMTATYAGHGVSGKPPTLEEVGLGASIGLGVGLLASYFIHQEVAKDREDNSKETEIYFGDLPPSPFVIPQENKKKGSR